MSSQNILIAHNFKLLYKDALVNQLQLSQEQVEQYSVGREPLPDNIVQQLCSYYGLHRQHFESLMLTGDLVKVLVDRALPHSDANRILLEEIKNHSKKNADLQEGVLKLIDKVVALTKENEKMKNFVEQVQGFVGPIDN